jgi:hypothetical protein
MDKLRVLGIIDSKGSRYHRVKLPLEKLVGKSVEDKEIEVKFLETINLVEEDLKDVNVLYANRAVPIDAVKLSSYLEKYSIKFILDLDDVIEVDSGHLGANLFNQWIPIIYRQLILADLVTVSALELVESVLPFNHNVAYIPNFIPFEEGQFTWDGNRVKSDKIRFGIVGSLSHINDINSIRDIVKKIASDREFQEKAKFVLAADENSPTWKKIISVFKHKNVELEILEPKSVDEYMSLYDNIDVLLHPLVDNKFNRSRSNLKILEAATREIPVITNSFMESKGLNCFLPIKKNSDWYKIIKAFIKNKDYREIGKEIKKFLIEKYPYSIGVDKRLELLEYVLNKEEKKLEDVKIWTITYDEKQHSPFETYDNSHIRTLEQNSHRFEYNVLLDICKNKLDDVEGYVGVFSYKFGQKTGLYPKMLNRLLLSKKYQEYDFINLVQKYWRDGKEYLQFSEEQHPGLLERLEEVCKVVGLKYYNNPSTVNYSNFYLMKKEYFQDYVNNYVIPALEYMEVKPERFMVDAQYKGGLDAEKLKELTEMEFYSFHTFVLERMLIMYLENKQLKTLNLL